MSPSTTTSILWLGREESSIQASSEDLLVTRVFGGRQDEPGYSVEPSTSMGAFVFGFVENRSGLLFRVLSLISRTGRGRSVWGGG